MPFVVNLTHGNHFLTPLWSVGVEEIYYLTWAPIVKWFRKHLLVILLGTVIVKTLLSIWAHSISQNALAIEALRMLQFEAMAIGGLCAYFLFHRRRPLGMHWLFTKPAQVVLILLLLIRLFCHTSATEFSPLYAAIFEHAVFTPLLLMIIFAWFILNVAVNERSILRFDSRALNYLGEISYGIYMYHALAISLVLVPFRNKYLAAPVLQATLLLHVLVMAVTLLFAAASKTFFEDKFLRYKRRFEATNGRSQSADRSEQDTSTSSPGLAA
jgi:peptidoglycan/LPS O-acetylase OafA/YrhL